MTTGPGSNMPKADPVREGNPLSLNMMKNMGRKDNNEGESGSSNGGNNSDNSALVSIGNHSFGFNFDSEEGNSSPPNSENSDSDGPSDQKLSAASLGSEAGASNQQRATGTLSAIANSKMAASEAHANAAALAVEGLQSIVSAHHASKSEAIQADRAQQRKRKSAGTSDNDSGGYNTDDEDNEKASDPASDEGPSRVSSASLNRSSSSGNDEKPKSKRKKNLDISKRVERNAREKERSSRIAKQISDLRSLLSSGGIIVPKGTKSSVLTEAANYIRMLQQHQYRCEVDRHQLVQQMQLIGGGAHGPQAAAAIRQVAAQNGVWSLGNFGGLPPKSALSASQGVKSEPQVSQQDASQVTTKIDLPDYRYVFNSCGIGMAIASMGGAFIDCNYLFAQLTSYTKQELCALTIFNLTARQDLQRAFDQISQLISPPSDSRLEEPIILRGSVKERTDLGLSISLVKGEDGIAKCFCVTIVKSPDSPFEAAKPVPASFDSIRQSLLTTSATNPPKEEGGISSSPTFTSG